MTEPTFSTEAAARRALRRLRPGVVATGATLMAVLLLSGCISSMLPKKQVTQVAPPPPPATGKLGPADVQVLLGTGSAFTETVVGGKTYMITLNADGSAQRTPNGSKTAETGTWRAADAGYCSKWGKATAEDCYTINRTAVASYDVVDAKNKVIAHLTM